MSYENHRPFFIFNFHHRRYSRCAFAQLGDTTGNEGGFTPQHRYDTELPDNLPPMHNKVRVESFQLPRKLQKTLHSESLYLGWEEAVIYYNTRTEIYTLHFHDDDRTRIYGFNKRGKPVLVDEVDR